MANRGADERISEDVLNEISRQVVDNILANDLIMIKDDVKNSLDVNRSSGLPKKIGLSSYETDETCLGKAVDSIDDKHLRLERTKFPMNDMNWNSKDAESTARNVSRTAGCRYENRTIVASVDKDGRNIIIGINDSQNLANEFAIPGILDGSKINDLSDGRSQASGGKQSYEADVKAYDDGDLVDIVDVVAERCEKVFTTMLTDDEEEKKMKAAPTRTKEFKLPTESGITGSLSNDLLEQIDESFSHSLTNEPLDGEFSKIADLNKLLGSKNNDSISSHIPSSSAGVSHLTGLKNESLEKYGRFDASQNLNPSFESVMGEVCWKENLPSLHDAVGNPDMVKSDDVTHSVNSGRYVVLESINDEFEANVSKSLLDEEVNAELVERIDESDLLQSIHGNELPSKILVFDDNAYPAANQDHFAEINYSLLSGTMERFVRPENYEEVMQNVLSSSENESNTEIIVDSVVNTPEIPSSAKETLDLSNMRDSHDDDDDKHRCLKSSSEEDASETIVSAAQSVTENVNEIFDAAKGSMRTFSDEMDVKDEHITGKLGFGAADEKNRSTESMEERDTSALSRITEKAAEIKENVTNAAGAITSDVEDGKETIKSDIMGISKSISAAVEPDRVKGGIEERVKDVTEGIASLKIMNGDEMIQISEETPDIEEPSSDAKYEITGVFDKTSHVFTSSIEKASEVLASSIEKASEVIMPIVEKASEVVQPFAEKSSEIMQPLADKSCEFLKPIVDKSSAVLQPIVDKSSEILQPFAEKSSEVFTPMFEKSTEILKTLDEKSSTYEREIVPHEGVFGTTSPKQGPSDRSSDHKDESVARTHDVGQGSRDKKSDTLKSKSSASNNPGPRWKRCTIL